MHPVIYHDLAQARIADLHRQAQRDANARVVSRGRYCAPAAHRAGTSP
jgi:hypothetical protein